MLFKIIKTKNILFDKNPMVPKKDEVKINFRQTN